MTLFRWIAAVAFAVGATPGLAQSDLDRCAAATPQFPQACSCVIDRAQAAGITGPTLSRLLSNDTAGVPIDLFQRYGLIYVQCIQDAVVGSVGTTPPMPPVETPAPSPAPAPVPFARFAQPVAPAPTVTPVGGPPVIREAPYTAYPADPFVMSMRDPLPPGQWGFVAFERPGEGFGGPGVHDGQGRMLHLSCFPFDLTARARLTIGGVPEYDQVQNLTVTVERGDGSVIYQRGARAIPVMGPFLASSLGRDLADALRAGSTVRFDILDGPTFAVGLSGSNDAIGPAICGDDRTRADAYLLNSSTVPNIGWEIEDSLAAGGLQPLAAYGVGPLYLPAIAMTCDRRLMLRSAVFGYGPFPYAGFASVDNYRGSAPSYAITFAEQGGYVATDPLDPALWQALQTGEVLEVTFNTDVEPGEFTNASYRLTGLAEALAIRDCDNPMGERPATPVTDLTNVGQSWVPADFGWAFDGMSGNPAPVPGASFSDPAGQISINIQCNGEPFLLDGWNDPSFFLRMEIDGDPATDRVVPWSTRRAQAFPEFEAYPFEDRILTGQTLRITWRDGSGRDVLFPLTGLPDALRAAGC